jgi:hypothetical protein
MEALKWFSSKVNSVYVGTQATNIPAVRLYETFGFKLVESEATFHIWVNLVIEHIVFITLIRWFSRSKADVKHSCA